MVNIVRVLAYILMLIGLILPPGPCLAAHSLSMGEPCSGELSIRADTETRSEGDCCDPAASAHSCGVGCCVTCEIVGVACLMPSKHASFCLDPFLLPHETVYCLLEAEPPIA